MAAKSNDACPRTLSFEGTGSGARKRRAIVVGATGATGRQLVSALLRSDRWEKVITVARRHFEFLGGQLSTGKLVQQIGVTPEQLEPGSWEGFDTLFVCLGTTRGQAGGAKGFVEVEVGLTNAFARKAWQEGVRHVSVVSAQGANHNMWVPSDLIHPLLYVRTLGQKEQAVISKGFRFCSIFRPGMLNRLTGDRLGENLINQLGLGLRVDALAQAMVIDAEAIPLSTQDDIPEMPVIFQGNSVITRLGHGWPAA